MAIERVSTLDFETKGIQPRPDYPPTGAGFSLMRPGERVGKYWAYGHKSGNNCTKAEAGAVLKDLWRSGDRVLFHHGKFDLEVALNDFGLPVLPWERIEDSLLLTFLYNPRLNSMKLKDVAEDLLDIKPDERDDLRAWILANVPEAKKKPSTWGAYIWIAPGQLAGRYANADVKMTRRLYNYLLPIIKDEGMMEAYERERQLMPILLKMEAAGVNVNHRGLQLALPKWKASEQEVAFDIFKRLKIPKRDWENFRSEGVYEGFTFSGPKLADAMESAGKVDAFMLTEKGNRSTAYDALIEVCDDRKLVDLLGEHSQINTCIGTFGIPWLRVADRSGGLIFTNYNQTRSPEGGASTGRLSSYPNLQNIIRSDKSPRVPRLRDFIIPPPGKWIVDRDYSQQELRILAHFEEGPLHARYQEDPNLDAHTEVHDQVLDVTGYDMERPAVKVLNFLQIYGGGVPALVKKLRVPLDQAQLLRTYHQRALPGVRELQKQIKALVKAGEPVVTWGGRVYYCEEPRMIKGRMRTFDYKLLNVIIQGSAADCTKQAMINYDAIVGKRWAEAPLTLQVHDSLAGHTKDRLRMHKELGAAMADVTFEIPMLSDGKSSLKSWGVMKKEKE